jgi:hypothetical protein
VLKDAVAEHALEGAALEREVEEVRLREVEPLVAAEVRARSVDGGRRVDGPDLRTGLEEDLGETPRAAADLEDALPVEPFRPARTREQALARDRLARDRVELDAPVAVPLLAEALGVAVVGDEARDPLASVERLPREQGCLG